MDGHVRNPRGGDEVAARLGLDIVSEPMPGDDGVVFACAGDRALKITGAKAEIATALALLRAQGEGHRHPAVPVVHDVRWMTCRTLVDGAERVYRTCAIVREDMADVYVADEHRVAWREALTLLDYGWTVGDERQIADAVAAWRAGPELREALDGLRWMRTATGVSVRDVRGCNLGVTVAGFCGQRDFSRAVVPAAVMAPVNALAFAELPEAAPTVCLVR